MRKNFSDHKNNLFEQGKVDTFLKKIAFLTCLDLMVHTLEQLKLKLGKKMGFINLLEKIK